MSWNNSNGSNNNGPWGQGPKKSNDQKPNSPWGGSGGGGNRPPDFDETLRATQEKLRSVMPGGDGFGFKSLLLFGLLALAGYAATGMYIVKNEEVGVETVFGKFTGITEPGWHFNYPYPVGSVVKPAVTTVNRMEIGMRAPTQRVISDGLMLTGDENIVDIYFDLQWQVSRAKPENFVFNLQNPEGTIRAVGESAMREVVGKRKIQAILTTDQVALANEVKQIMQTTLDSYGAGIELRVVQLQRAEPPTQVRAAFLDVAAAQQDQERLQNQAREYQNGVVPKARGQAQTMTQEAEAYRDRLKAEAIGEAARFSKLYVEYQRAPEVTRERLFLENTAKIYGRTDKLILDQGAVPLLQLEQLLKGAGK